ncbi:hypothetical protein [Halobellus captivus]|uniref:hypothetical protein n=1 Tax=Halobellus captivus TaxID=2592614 RepID=UPI0011A62D65|nr:hypothetical protein [Halobellus captivus]
MFYDTLTGKGLSGFPEFPITYQMVDPGASSDEIRGEIFESFTSRIEESDIDEEIAETVLTEVLADDPPREFSDELIATIGDNDEA